MRKIIAIVTIVLFINFSYQVEKAQALLPLVLLAPETYYVVAAALATVGIGYASSEEGQRACAVAWNNIGPPTKQRIVDAIAAAGADGIARWLMNGEDVDEIRNAGAAAIAAAENGDEFETPSEGGWIDADTVNSFGHSSMGSEQVTQEIRWTITDDQTYYGVIKISWEGGFLQETNNHIAGGSQHTISLDGYELVNETAGVGASYTHNAFLTYKSAAQGGGVSLILDGTEIFTDTRTATGNKDIWRDQPYSHIDCEFRTVTNEVIVLDPTQIVYNTNIYNNEAAMAALPGTTLEVDIASGAVTGTINPPITVPNTIDIAGIIGWLKTIWNSMVNGLNGVKSGIAGVVAAVGAITAEPPVRPELNLDPLKLTGTILTTAFPFSLPWDIQRMFQSLDGASWSGIFDIPLVVPGVNYTMHIDLSFWDPVRNIGKTFVLLLFDMGLIMATRKLLGGDV